MKKRIISLGDLASLVIMGLIVALMVLLLLWIHELKLRNHEYELYSHLRSDLKEMCLTQPVRKAGNREAEMFDSSVIDKLENSDIAIDRYEEEGEGIIQLSFHGRVSAVAKALIMLRPFRLTRIDLEKGDTIDEGIQVRVSVQCFNH